MSAITIRYYGWSSLSIDTPDGALFFDPFYRRYCGAQWFGPQDFLRARYICVTHGHEEHFLDVPVIAKSANATVIGPRSVTAFLKWRTRIKADKLVSVQPGQSIDVPGFRIAAFGWKHRDINLVKALTRAMFHGNATQLAWAWSSAINAPFYAPYTGFHLTLPDGLTVMNYNEGFNTKMTDAEIEQLGARFRTDVLLAGMQLDFVNDVARGAAALNPRVVLLYPPHEKFHEMMGVTSRPWAEFAAAVRAAVPSARVVVAQPGTSIDARTGELVAQTAAKLAA